MGRKNKRAGGKSKITRRECQRNGLVHGDINIGKIVPDDSKATHDLLWADPGNASAKVYSCPMCPRENHVNVDTMVDMSQRSGCIVTYIPTTRGAPPPTESIGKRIWVCSLGHLKSMMRCSDVSDMVGCVGCSEHVGSTAHYIGHSSKPPTSVDEKGHDVQDTPSISADEFNQLPRIGMLSCTSCVLDIVAITRDNAKGHDIAECAKLITDSDTASTSVCIICPFGDRIALPIRIPTGSPQCANCDRGAVPDFTCPYDLMRFCGPSCRDKCVDHKHRCPARVTRFAFIITTGCCECGERLMTPRSSVDRPCATSQQRANNRTDYNPMHTRTQGNDIATDICVRDGIASYVVYFSNTRLAIQLGMRFLDAIAAIMDIPKSPTLVFEMHKIATAQFVVMPTHLRCSRNFSSMGPVLPTVHVVNVVDSTKVSLDGLCGVRRRCDCEDSKDESK